MQDNRFENLSEEARAELLASPSPEDHLEADSSSLSFDDLDSVTGGVRGRK